MNCTVVVQCRRGTMYTNDKRSYCLKCYAYNFLRGLIKSVEEQLHRIKGLRHEHLIPHLHNVEHFEKKLCIS